MVSNDFMTHGVLRSLWRMSALVSILALPLPNLSPAYQSPIPQAQGTGTQEARLTLAEEQDSYEIYSMLLQTEMPPGWNVSAWNIAEQTRTFPQFVQHNIRECLSVSQGQESIYLPLFEDYLAKNQRKRTLERKFDLPQYALVEFGRASAGSVVFEVSAVGFNNDRTRALVYVGHHCGNLCGGGQYHLLVKKEGKWQIDREHHGLSCVWRS
jgi:hypothetical protein